MIDFSRNHQINTKTNYHRTIRRVANVSVFSWICIQVGTVSPENSPTVKVVWSVDLGPTDGPAKWNPYSDAVSAKVLNFFI